MADLFGEDREQATERYKLHRKDAPETSIKAAYSVDVTKREQDVLSIIEATGEAGITLTELCDNHGRGTASNIPFGTLSARPAGLEEKGLIHYRGDIRNNSRIMRAAKHKKGISFCPKCEGVLLKFYGLECQLCKSLV